MVKVAIVILNWNGIDYLKRFLSTAVKNSGSTGTVFYIADNNSTDGSADWVAMNFPSIKIIRNSKNLGFAGGYNLALQQIDAEYFILLNSDIEVTEGWTKPLISFMENNRDVASCQPKILSWHNKDYFEYAGAAGGYLDKYGYPFCTGRLFHFTEKDEGQYDTPEDVFWTSGACMIVRAEAWRQCNGFDADFFAHMEEIDLCWRFHFAGYRVCYLPEPVVYHVGGGALPYDSPFKTYLNFRNNLFLLYKNLPDNKLHYILFVRKLLDGIAASVFLFSGKFSNVKSVWKAHKDYYKNIKSLKAKRETGRILYDKKSINTIMNKSIVFEFYIKGIRTFDRLKINI
jgi:GT2 family glycosyltransferase